MRLVATACSSGCMHYLVGRNSFLCIATVYVTVKKERYGSLCIHRGSSIYITSCNVKHYWGAGAMRMLICLHTDVSHVLFSN